ncbi:hypothetical protein OG21DRAFT_1419643 [Imleria badia]|nr:hypothetical protein OG21DRAFT_1419643 [Imleria badia]
MFGDFPSSSSTNKGLYTIFSPSSSNVQSINDDSGAKRFSRATFRPTSLSPDDDGGPPTKKPRLDDIASFQARWESAVQSMDKASTLEKDGLPALLSTYATTGGSSASKKSLMESTRKLKPQRSRANLNSDAHKSTPRAWSPCPPDPTLQIPGELVLALAPKTGGAYWPGQILQHVEGRKEKYKVKFLDDEEHIITRDRFWTSEEEGFVRCTLGEWESAIKTTDDVESDDEGDEFGADDPNVQDLDESALPPPPPAGDFQDLSVRAQLAYVKPVLRAILNKEYAPTRAMHEAFMRGGSGRLSLLKSAGVRGGMDARFVKAVQKAICKWVLGDTGMKPEKLNIGTGSSEDSTVKITSPGAVPAEILPPDSMQDDKMEGIEGAVVPEDVHTANGALPLTTPDKQVELAQVTEMAVDGHEQDMSSQPSPLTPIPVEDQQPPSQKSVLVVSQEFETLSGVEKLDASASLYCLNILLPESIQQLLLWRSGDRTSAALLSPEEEQRLHDAGARKAAETDWVDDVMRLRVAQARLWGVDLNKKAEEKKADVAQGGTRSRPQRGTVSRP